MRALPPHHLSDHYTGRGVGIAVVDTGIYPHPDFYSPVGRVVGFHDCINDGTIPYDDNGHGTHVAGDAAGNGHMSGGKYRGPAPDALLVGIKALDKQGQGNPRDILDGLNWAVENKQRYNIRVMNLSLGSGSASAKEAQAIKDAIEDAYKAGIVVVMSAGNNGPGPNSIYSPADSPYAITVGALDDAGTPDPSDDRIANFSGRGAAGSGKPDLVARGVGVIGPSSPGSTFEETAKQYEVARETLSWLQGLSDKELTQVPTQTLGLLELNQETIARFKSSPSVARQELDRVMNHVARLPRVEGNYIGMPGTSTAAPIVAGVIAQMLEANPDLTPGQVKEILVQTASPLDAVPSEMQGAGVVEPEAALRMALDLR